MSRKPRHDSEGGVHHVMNRGVNHQRIFFGDADRIEFGDRLHTIHERFRVETLAYALMDNHYHVLLRTLDGGLSDAMHHLGMVFARRTNDRVGRDGPLFKNRFHSIPVTTDAYLAHAARYIHLNPLARAGVASPRDYRWTSYRAYLGMRPTAPFLNTAPVLSLFVETADFAQYTEDEPRAGVSFVPTSLADVLQLVRLAIAVEDMSGVHPEGPPRYVERAVVILTVEALDDPALRHELDDWLDRPSPAARRMAIKRARDRADDPWISSAVRRALAHSPAVRAA